MRALVVAAALTLAVLSAGFAASSQAERRSERDSQLVWRRAIGVELDRRHAEIERLRRQVSNLRTVLRHRPSVREALDLAAVAFGVPRWQLAAVAWRESRLRPDISNFEGSGAAGLFQFMPGTFASTPFGAAGLSVFSPYANALAAAWQVAHHGWSAWGGQP